MGLLHPARELRASFLEDWWLGFCFSVAWMGFVFLDITTLGPGARCFYRCLLLSPAALRVLAGVGYACIVSGAGVIAYNLLISWTLEVSSR